MTYPTCDTYPLDYRCTNCGAVEAHRFPRGNLAPGTATCSRCGCRTAHPLGWNAPHRRPTLSLTARPR